MPIKNIKAEIRRSQILKRKCLSKEEKERLDWDVSQKIFNSSVYKNCSCLFAYVSMPFEVSTEQIIKRAWSDGKKVALPVCDKNTGRMIFRLFNKGDKLIDGDYGIPSPSAECPQVDADESVLILVPLIAVDRKGNRIGFGGGYYDRYLGLHKAANAVGLFYPTDIFENLPCEEHDIKISIKECV